MQEREERMYTEKEVARVLRRAADLQAEAGLQDGFAKGSSRAELERIGEEVGIDPAFVAKAIADINLDGVDEDHRGQSRWLGAPPEYVVERTITGQLSPQAWETVVGLLNAEFKQSIPGVVSGNIYTWQWKHELGWVHCSASQTGLGIRLRLTLHLDDGLVAGLVPTGIAWFALATLFFSADSLRPVFSILFSAIALIGLAMAFRTIASSWWRKDRRKSARLMDQLIEACQPTALPTPSNATLPTEDELRVRLITD